MAARLAAETIPTPSKPAGAVLAYGASLLACAAAATAGSLLTRPKIDGFYQALVKPAFTPPNWVFPVAWTGLYLLMALAAGRIATRPIGRDRRRSALLLFAVQLVLGVVWSWTFFGRESLAAGLLTIVFLLAAVAATALTFGRIDRPAGLMLVPLAAWVAYAGLLNATILALN